FYAAQDADNFTSAEASEPEEGDFYVWSMAELTTLLAADELSELTTEFTVTEAGNFEGRNVLQRKSSRQLSQTVEQALEKLFQVRYGALPADTPTFNPAVDAQAAKTVNWPGRIPPVTDTKMIVAWNALMISGLAKAAAVFDRADYLAIALQATQYIQQHQQSEGTFYRLNYDGQAAVPAQAEDYALYIKALLDIQQACLRFDEYRAQAADWLTAAIALQTQFDQQLGSKQGGYFNATGNELIVQERAYQDSAIPSANGVAIASLMRLFLLTENQDYLSRAETALQSFSTVLQKVPRACPSLLSALDWFTHPMLIRTTTDQIPELMNQMLPTAVLQIEELPEGAIALVCHGLSCQAPATDIAMLQNQIKQSQGL
ncbi:MAG: thioredoxin domain-containing protein, partial [Phormidesmis sp.]